jgi:hypothetical protein
VPEEAGSAEGSMEEGSMEEGTVEEEGGEADDQTPIHHHVLNKLAEIDLGIVALCVVALGALVVCIAVKCGKGTIYGVEVDDGFFTVSTGSITMLAQLPGEESDEESDSEEGSEEESEEDEESPRSMTVQEREESQGHAASHVITVGIPSSARLRAAAEETGVIDWSAFDDADDDEYFFVS